MSLTLTMGKVIFNPLSAMGDFRHHIIMNFAYLRVKGVTYGLISCGNCSLERLTLAKTDF
jgi:hypothetical protein